YRYFPEPDLVPLAPERGLVERLRSELPEPPGARVRRLEGDVGFDTAWELVTTGRDTEYDKLAGAGVAARAAANVVRNEGAGITVAEHEELAEVIGARDQLSCVLHLEGVTASGQSGFSVKPYPGQTPLAVTFVHALIVVRAVRDCLPPADELGTRTLTPHELRACLDRG